MQTRLPVALASGDGGQVFRILKFYE